MPPAVRRTLGLLILGGLILGPPVPWARAAIPCPAAPRMPMPSLSHLQAALAAGEEGVIVALGSSSTSGAMASDPAHEYPAVLQAALTQALPHAHIAVLNRGIGGQDAPEELARLQADAIAIRPQLVIWQVGVNGALHHIDPDEFRSLVREGVSRLQEAGIDVILMDSQRSPRVIAAPEHAALDKALAAIAKETGAGLFSREALMRAWSEEGAASVDFVATDGLHHNDRGYACIARALGETILSGLHETATLRASQ